MPSTVSTILPIGPQDRRPQHPEAGALLDETHDEPGGDWEAASEPSSLFLLDRCQADYIRAVPTISPTNDELAAVTAAIRRAIEDDRFPRAPRLDPLRAALAKLEADPEPSALPKAPPSA